MLAYPELPGDAWQSMACEAFIDSISSDEANRFVLQAMPIDLLSAITAARQFQAIKSRKRDRKLEVPVQVRAVDQVDEVCIKESINDLARQVKSLAVSQKSLFEQVNTLQLNKPNQRFPRNKTHMLTQCLMAIKMGSVIQYRVFLGAHRHGFTAIKGINGHPNQGITGVSNAIRKGISKGNVL